MPKHTRAPLASAIAVGLLSFLASFIRLLPLTGVSMRSGLDDGWSQAINYACTHGLVFGRDLVFTYGPYAAIVTRAYDPALRAMMIGSAALFAAGLATGWAALARPVLMLAAILALPLMPADAMAFVLPLPAMLLCAQAPPGRPLPAEAALATAGALPALALLPLVKGSFLIATALSITLLAGLLWRARHPRLAAILPAATLLCMSVLWCAAGQPAAALGVYFSNEIPIITGYNASMSWLTDWHGPACAAAASVTALIVLAWAARQALPRATALLLGFGLTALVFLIFKAGNVRQDEDHEAIAMMALALLALVVAAWAPPKPALEHYQPDRNRLRRRWLLRADKNARQNKELERGDECGRVCSHGDPALEHYQPDRNRLRRRWLLTADKNARENIELERGDECGRVCSHGDPALVAAALSLLIVTVLLPPLGLGVSAGQTLFRWHGDLTSARRLLTAPRQAAQNYRASQQAMPGLPWHPAGTADIYSTNQLALFASGLAWSPRPVLQSYSAYTPALAALNANHLLTERAPRNIFFRPEPIDLRLPSLEDGASWPALLSLYQPVAYNEAADTAWLRRLPDGARLAAPGPLLLAETATLGQPVKLPSSADPIWASIEPAPSAAGRLAALLLQAPPLNIRLDFANGTSQSFRFIPGMARNGFVLTPFVATALDFLRLNSSVSAPPWRRVIAFTLGPAPGRAWAWRPTFRLTLQSLRLPRMNLPESVRISATLRPIALPPAAPPAACYLDTANGGAIPPAGIPATAPLQLRGWAMFAPGKPTQADAVEFAFQPENGDAFAVPAQFSPRGDVDAAFGLPLSFRAGVTMEADPTQLPAGTYRITMLVHHGGVVRVCQSASTLVVGPNAGRP